MVLNRESFNGQTGISETKRCTNIQQKQKCARSRKGKIRFDKLKYLTISHKEGNYVLTGITKNVRFLWFSKFSQITCVVYATTISKIKLLK